MEFKICVCSPCILGPKGFEASGILAGLNTETTRSQMFSRALKAREEIKPGVVECEISERHSVSPGAGGDLGRCWKGPVEQIA